LSEDNKKEISEDYDQKISEDYKYGDFLREVREEFCSRISLDFSQKFSNYILIHLGY